jgi:hypothetical protein
MRVQNESFGVSLATACVAASLLLTGCGAMEKLGLGGNKPVTAELTGAKEVPPVSTKASGRSTITVANDMSVSGSVIVENMAPTAAHIHQGAEGANGPIIVPLTKASDKMFSVPPNARLTDAQYAAYKNGDLYINVHSAAHPPGEIRVQMKP